MEVASGSSRARYLLQLRLARRGEAAILQAKNAAQVTSNSVKPSVKPAGIIFGAFGGWLIFEPKIRAFVFLILLLLRHHHASH